MTVVQNRLVDSSGRPLQRQTVKILAVTGGDTFTGAARRAEVITFATASTDRSGLWSLDLPPTSSFANANAHYLVDQADGLRGVTPWAIKVPDAGGPYWLAQLLVDGGFIEPTNPGALPTEVALVYVKGADGILRLREASDVQQWGEQVRFTAAEPPASDAPEGAVYVNYLTGMIYRAEG